MQFLILSAALSTNIANRVKQSYTIITLERFLIFIFSRCRAKQIIQSCLKNVRLILYHHTFESKLPQRNIFEVVMLLKIFCLLKITQITLLIELAKKDL